jgi:hypothetical protein
VYDQGTLVRTAIANVRHVIFVGLTVNLLVTWLLIPIGYQELHSRDAQPAVS